MSSDINCEFQNLIDGTLWNTKTQCELKRNISYILLVSSVTIIVNEKL